ncbi:MAG: Na/Pi symporter [bacterium]
MKSIITALILLVALPPIVYGEQELFSSSVEIDSVLVLDNLRIRLIGNEQDGRAGCWLKHPLQVCLTDSAGNPVSGAEVEFWIDEHSDGEVSNPRAITDNQGYAATDLRLPSKTGQYNISALVKQRDLPAVRLKFRTIAFSSRKMAFGLIGGVGIFLYGMLLLSTSLQKVAGQRLRRLLELLTSNRLVGAAVGALVTAVIQSSSVTSVMVVGFVNAGLLRLQQAIGVIIGANIGTTITGQIIAFKIDLYGLPLIGIGLAIIMLAKLRQQRLWGEAIVGFGLLFVGLTLMKETLAGLSASNTMKSFFVNFSREPILGVLGGALVTGIIQSSSATVGLTMALASAGLVDLRGAISLVLGENIGTTITAQIASIGSSRTARQAAWSHTLFNVFGVAYMTGILYSGNWYERLVELTSDDLMRQVANSHTLFNVVNAALFLPMLPVLKFFVEKIAPKKENEEVLEPRHLERHLLDTPLIAINQVKNEIVRMANLAREAVRVSTQGLIGNNSSCLERTRDLEDAIDNFQGAITHYLVELARRPLTEVESEQLPVLLHTINDLERVGDHAENIVELAERKMIQKIRIGEDTVRHINLIADEVDVMASHMVAALAGNDLDQAKHVLKLEERLNRLYLEMKQGFGQRLAGGVAEVSSGVLFFDLIMNYERIGDHYTNIAQAVLGQFQWDKGVKAIHGKEMLLTSKLGGKCEPAIKDQTSSSDGS